MPGSGGLEELLAEPGVVGLVAGRIRPVGAHERDPDQRDEDRERVEREDLLLPVGERGGQRDDQVHHAAEVAGDAQEERDQLGDVRHRAAEPGDDQRRPGVEHRLQQDRRDQQQPVDAWVLSADHHDDGDDDHADQHLLEFDDHVRERQRGAREIERADQLQVRPHHVGAGHDRPLAEREHEHARDQERRVVGHAPGGLEQQAEDQVVDARVEQRREHLPELPEPGLGVHRDVARGGVADDEVPALPEACQVRAQRRAGPGVPQPVLGGELGEVAVGHLGRLGRDDSTGLQAARRADLPTRADLATVVHDREVYWTPAMGLARTEGLRVTRGRSDDESLCF